MEEFAGLIAAMGIFGWIPIAVYFKHKIRLEELKMHRRAGDDNTSQSTAQALQELRREVQALRDTTTKFDMSFDASISRLEERVDRIEERNAATRGATDAPTATVNRG